MTLNIREEVPPAEQFWPLFQSTGWNQEYRLSSSEVMQGLHNSWYAVAAYEGDVLVGFGRVVSDTVLHAMIYELIVLPDHQRRGIGTRILDMLLQRCRREKIRDIQLFCARGKRSFYEKRGFVARPDDAPGMQYRPGNETLLEHQAG
jgi:GNAT superfamily N-acetyltransferase